MRNQNTVNTFAMLGALGAFQLVTVGCAEQEGVVGKSVVHVERDNGIKLNGIKLNGIKLNGIKLNGIKLNGIKLNGIKLNGIKLNGIDPLQGNIRYGIDARELNAGLSDADACNLARHIVWYAFDEGDERGVVCMIDGEATLLKEEGGLGVYTNLGTDNQDPADAARGVQALMDTICGAAFNNTPRPVSWRGYRGPPLNGVIGSTDEERHEYGYREGLFWAAIDAAGDFTCHFVPGDDGFSEPMFDAVVKRFCAENTCDWFVYHAAADVMGFSAEGGHCESVDPVNGHTNCRDEANGSGSGELKSGSIPGGGGDGAGGGGTTSLSGNVVGGRGVWLDVKNTCEHFKVCSVGEPPM